MLKRNVVLIKNNRKKSAKNKDKLTVFLRTFFIVVLIISCIISVLLLMAKVDEESKQIGFGTTNSAMEIQDEDANYVMHFFSKNVEIPKAKVKETVNSIWNFASCLLNPVVRVVWQGIELIT